MKKIKINKLIYPIASAILLSPLVSLAQWTPSNYAETKLPAGTIYDIIKNLMMWLLGIFGFIGIIGFVIAGIMYLTAAGSDDQITKAKSAMKWSLVGVVVGLVGLVIIYAVDTALAPGTTGGLF